MQSLRQEFPIPMMDLKEILTKAGRKVTIGTRDALETQFGRGEERVSRMINGGMNLNAALLDLRGQHLTWNLPGKLANVIGAKGSFRVWIEFQSPIHTQAWYPESSEPHLRIFAFKAGMPNETIEEAHYFWLMVQGAKETPDRADVLATARELATFIVRTARCSRSGGERHTSCITVRKRRLRRMDLVSSRKMASHCGTDVHFLITIFAALFAS